MKALTLHQPWATLIAIGAKQVETRDWATTYRGPLVIHAGKTLLHDPRNYAFMSWLAKVGIHDLKALPLGAGLCVVNLVHIWRTEDCVYDMSEQERDFGDFSPGRAAWKLEMVRVFKNPIPAKGAQGLWDWVW